MSLGPALRRRRAAGQTAPPKPPPETRPPCDDGGMQYRELFENAPFGIYRCRLSGEILDANPALAEILLYAAARELIGRSMLEFYAVPAEHGAVVARAEREGIVRGHELRLRRRDGTAFWARLNLRAIRDAAGCVVALEGSVEDVNAVKEAERTLRASEARLAEAQELARLGSWEWAPDTDRLIASAELHRLFDAPAERISTGEQAIERVAQSDRPRVRQAMLAASSDGGAGLAEVTFRVPTSSGTRTLQARGRTVRDERGRVLRVVGTVQDVTERIAADEALRESEERYRQLVECSPDAVVVHENGVILYANPAAAALVGAAAANELIGQNGVCFIHRDGQPAAVERIADAQTRRRRVRLHRERMVRLDGRLIDVEISAVPAQYQGRAVLQTIVRDVTERLAAERSLRESEERFRQLADNIDEVFWIVDPETGRPTYLSPACERLWGRSPAEAIAHPRVLLDSVYAEDRHRVRTAVADWVASRGTAPLQQKFRIVRKDGAIRWVSATGFTVRDGRGAVVRLAGISRDVTEQHDLEQRLRQSQKLEAIGRLAGGVAHDFNNLLTIIRGSADLALAELDPAAPIVEDLCAIGAAADRAADLTRQLLAFARRQVVSRQVLDVNEVIEGASRMIRRLIGEDIRLLTMPSGGLWRVSMDRGQLEQVLLNLAVNARDAMPRGGDLLIATANAPLREPYPGGGLLAGDYVKLLVRDTGCGMNEEVRAHVFEPFFTTKKSGEGTGLGLATCYGIVTQAGGGITVASEPGRGAAFTIYLPRCDAESEPREREPGVRPPAIGRETVLLVEDEPPVRSLAARILRGRGYSVIEATSGESAMAMVKSRGDEALDLLLTDVVMPGLRGTELARRVRALRPSLKILFTTGYADDFTLRSDGDELGRWVLPKPFTPESLAAKVREVLDA